MTIPAEKTRLLEDIAGRLATVPNVEAVALGGSHARGMHRPESDLDIGIHYREGAPFAIDDIRAIAKAFSAGGSPTVTDFYDWGPFVNGGAWIDTRVCKIDFLYRNLDQLERIVADAHQGRSDHSFDQQPPFGFRSVTALGEIHIAKPLHDPKNVLVPLKAAVASFPSALKTRIVRDTLGMAEFTFIHARNYYAKAGDVPNTASCMTRIFHYLVHALFALNETYLVNDKTSLKEIESFPTKPQDFGVRVSAILAAPGGSPETLDASLDHLKELLAETTALSGSYKPRFDVR